MWRCDVNRALKLFSPSEIIIWIPEFWEFFSCRIGNPELWIQNWAQGIRNPTNNWNPESKFLYQGIRNPTNNWNPESKFQYQGIRNPTNNCNPESKFLYQGIRNPTNNWNPESKFHYQGMWNPQRGSRIQDRLGLPYMKRLFWKPYSNLGLIRAYKKTETYNIIVTYSCPYSEVWTLKGTLRLFFGGNDVDLGRK